MVNPGPERNWRPTKNKEQRTKNKEQRNAKSGEERKEKGKKSLPKVV